MAENGPCDGDSLVQSKCNNSFVLGNNVLKNIFEEFFGLGRDAVMFAGYGIQTIESFNRIPGIIESNLDVRFSRFFDVSPGTVSKAFKDFLFAP